MKTKILMFVLGFFVTFVAKSQLPSAQLLLNGSDVGPEYTMCRGSIVLSTGIAGTVYAWQKTDLAGVSTDLGNTPTLTLTPTENKVKYGVYVNSGGILHYDTLVLTINNIPSVNVLPNQTDVCEAATVVIQATNSPLPAHTYQWYENGVPLSNVVNVYSGATTYELTITGNASLSGRRYDCRVIADYGCSAYARTSGGQGTLLQVNALPLNQIPTVNVAVVNDIATVCGLTVPIIIGLTDTQLNYIYELYDVNSGTIIDTMIGTDGPIVFSTQVADRKFGIRVWTPTRGCSFIIHK